MVTTGHLWSPQLVISSHLPVNASPPPSDHSTVHPIA